MYKLREGGAKVDGDDDGIVLGVEGGLHLRREKGVIRWIKWQEWRGEKGERVRECEGV